ncbi:hypothetical protein AYL99_05634 [Fonsecaea erecta]|uniref:Mitochondrial ATPase complex subunit ATP10 n=1 Tax=Fonsecaea erecta TaxID=1367422 RepID=A0A178ZLW0_9EURO|nr:hypothetical protein AYL99_05634 [Fonsecaea erecta]OAP60632.1 hypothetical protein AYL99_05634 [Fonsecaea erecta]
MSRKDVLSLFISLTLRPHSRCAFRLKNVSRRASTSNSPTTEKARIEIKKPTIPLHVGLDRNPENLSAISRIPIPRGVTGEKFTPSALARPLGLEHPPRPGQNSPIDNRTLRERHEDFTSYEKALERRRVYLRTFFRPYFQEWRRVDHFKGKSFVSNPRLFKREKALYFPNIWGRTLAAEGDGPQGGRDTTPILMGKVSVIAMQSGHWAEEQVDTFISLKSNPELNKMMEESNGRLQRVDINLQGDWVRALLVKMFSKRLRQTIPEERWNKYFMIKLPRDIRRGLNDEVRDAIGLLNSQVGYVYLVDSSCKIRWAGSGHAWEGEVEGLNAAVRRLLQEEQNLGQTASQTTSNRPKSVIPKPRVPTPEIDRSTATMNKGNAKPSAITT